MNKNCYLNVNKYALVYVSPPLNLSKELEQTDIINYSEIKCVFETIINKNFIDEDLKGVDFSYKNLININFTNADLRKTNFKGSTFTNVKLDNALLCDGFKFKNEFSTLELEIMSKIDEGKIEEAERLHNIKHCLLASDYAESIQNLIKEKISKINEGKTEEVHAINNIHFELFFTQYTKDLANLRENNL